MKSLIKSKRGVLGLDTAKAVVLALLVLAITAIAVFLALNSIDNASLFTSGSVMSSQSKGIIGNISTGTTSFFANAGTWFTLLAVVVIILIISIVIVAVSRFGGRTEQL